MKKLQTLLPVALLSLALPTAGLLAAGGSCCPGCPVPLPGELLCQDEEPEGKDDGVQTLLCLAADDGEEQPTCSDEEIKPVPGKLFLLADDEPTEEKGLLRDEDPEPKPFRLA